MTCKKKSVKNRIIAILSLGFIVTSSLLFTGCGAKKIFKDEAEDYTLKALSDKELEQNTYYVKDAATFYQTYDPSKNFSDKANIADSSRIIYTDDYESLIPTMYKDGLIAYASDKNVALTNVSLERFEYIGDSVGVYKAELDANGYIYIKKENLIKDTSLYAVLSQEKADSFSITEINGKEVSKDMLSNGGVIKNLEYGKSYKISFYSGTYYKTVSVIADRHFYRSFEMYQTEDIDTTKNGYISIQMPKNINSGYYYVDGKGFFKYYNVTKDEVNDSIDLNEAYYTSEADQISAYSQAYVVNVSQPTYDVDFRVTYDTTNIEDSDIVAILTAPDKTTYRMAALAGSIDTYLDYAMAGRWTINIVPQDLNILEVTAESSQTGDDATVEVYTFDLEESSNQVFTVTYTGDGDVWGTVTYEDGTAIEFSKPKKDGDKNVITANLTYVGAGTYTVSVYHYADTIIDEPTVSADDDALSDFNIVVESD